MTEASISNCDRLMEGTPYCLLSSSVISSSLTNPRRDQIEADLPAVRLLVVQRLLQLGRRDALFFEEQLTYANGHRLDPAWTEVHGPQSHRLAAHGRHTSGNQLPGEVSSLAPVTFFVKRKNAGVEKRSESDARGNAPPWSARLGSDRRLTVDPERRQHREAAANREDGGMSARLAAERVHAEPGARVGAREEPRLAAEGELLHPAERPAARR